MLLRFLIATICIWIISYVIIHGIEEIEEKQLLPMGLFDYALLSITLAASIATASKDNAISLLILTIPVMIYGVCCTITDLKECYIYRILHYPIIIGAIVYGLENHRFEIPFMYILLLILSRVLRAYKAGDTWMFITFGSVLWSMGASTLLLIIFWIIAISIFLISNIPNMVIKTKNNKKTLEFNKGQPVGPSIFTAFLVIFMMFQYIY